LDNVTILKLRCVSKDDGYVGWGGGR
jgi:hypothetical protein